MEAGGEVREGGGNGRILTRLLRAQTQMLVIRHASSARERQVGVEQTFERIDVAVHEKRDCRVVIVAQLGELSQADLSSNWGRGLRLRIGHHDVWDRGGRAHG